MRIEERRRVADPSWTDTDGGGERLVEGVSETESIRPEGR